MNYKFIGKMSPSVIEEIKSFVIRAYSKVVPRYQFIMFSPEVTEKIQALIFPDNFENESVKLRDTKVFVTPPGVGFGLHRDGPDRLCAVNVVIECNDADWVRWYSDSDIQAAGGVEVAYPNSRNIVNLPKFEELPFEEEVTNQSPGDVYLLDTDKLHSFKNNGLNTRFVVQTKFSINPTFDEVDARIKETGLLNIL